jgi:SAM-dependent methyltransferase
LTRELVAVLGEDHVAAVDPSPSFVAAARERLPGVDVRVAGAEELPFGDDTFDHALAQLVVNFMTDPLAGVGEMIRVTRPGGHVSAATWDYAEGMTYLRTLWAAAAAIDPAAAELDEARTMRYCTPDELRDLLVSVGLANVVVSSAEPTAKYLDMHDLWAPLAAGVGPAGVYVAGLDSATQELVEAEYARRIGFRGEPFELTARAWIATGEVR